MSGGGGMILCRRRLQRKAPVSEVIALGTKSALVFNEWNLIFNIVEDISPLKRRLPRRLAKSHSFIDSYGLDADPNGFTYGEGGMTLFN